MLTKTQNLLKQNFIIVKTSEFKKLNNLEKAFLSHFFDVKTHWYDENLLVLEKKQKYIMQKIFILCLDKF